MRRLITERPLPNFSADELRCKGSGKLILAPGFGQALQGLRDALGEPMPVNSCCRSAAHNESVGGHSRSLHVCDLPYWQTQGTCAVDIGFVEGVHDKLRGRLVELAWKRGWSIGFHNLFLHLDLRTEYVGMMQAEFSY